MLFPLLTGAATGLQSVPHGAWRAATVVGQKATRAFIRSKLGIEEVATLAAADHQPRLSQTSQMNESVEPERPVVWPVPTGCIPQAPFDEAGG